LSGESSGRGMVVRRPEQQFNIMPHDWAVDEPKYNNMLDCSDLLPEDFHRTDEDLLMVDAEDPIMSIPEQEQLCQRITRLSGEKLMELKQLISREDPDSLRYENAQWEFDTSTMRPYMVYKIRDFVDYALGETSMLMPTHSLNSQTSFSGSFQPLTTTTSSSSSSSSFIYPSPAPGYIKMHCPKTEKQQHTEPLDTPYSPSPYVPSNSFYNPHQQHQHHQPREQANEATDPEQHLPEPGTEPRRSSYGPSASAGHELDNFTQPQQQMSSQAPNYVYSNNSSSSCNNNNSHNNKDANGNLYASGNQQTMSPSQALRSSMSACSDTPRYLSANPRTASEQAQQQTHNKKQESMPVTDNVYNPSSVKAENPSNHQQQHLQQQQQEDHQQTESTSTTPKRMRAATGPPLTRGEFLETISGINVYRPLETPGKKKAIRFMCDACEKGFRKRSEVVVHIRVHTGERPLKCSMCDRRFAHPSNLRAHERKHPDTKFTCTVPGCGETFSDPDLLKSHTLAHQHTSNGFACSECAQSFRTKLKLHKHMEEAH